MHLIPQNKTTLVFQWMYAHDCYELGLAVIPPGENAPSTYADFKIEGVSVKALFFRGEEMERILRQEGEIIINRYPRKRLGFSDAVVRHYMPSDELCRPSKSKKRKKR